MQAEHKQSPRWHVTLESVDDRMISLMRLILALSALLIIKIDPLQPDRSTALTYSALVLYSLYSAALFLLALRRPKLVSAFTPYAHWVDVACYLLLVTLSSGTSSIFFFFFFFAVMVASFRKGFKEGLRVAVVSAILFTVIGYASAPAEPHFELNRFLLRPIYLIVLGYMIAYSGGSELVLKRRLALLKEVNRLSNPRFGVDQTIDSIMGQVSAFYEADSCLLVMAEGRGHVARLCERRNSHPSVRAESLTPETAAILFGLPPTAAVAYNRARRWSVRGALAFACDVETNERLDGLREASEALADMLGTQSVVTLPLVRQGKATGRMFLTSDRHRFYPQDVDFLRQVVEHIAPVIENIRLLDRLATEAAEQERQKISRDLHDSAIQPYIGLKLGLDALARKVAPGDAISADIEELIRMASDQISDLRSLVGNISRGEREREENTGLVPAVRRHAAKFTEFYHIKVDVRAETELRINDRLAAEAFQILREGLSNIRRHTRAGSASIDLACAGDQFIMKIGNDGAIDSTEAFTPRSITERATALGGRTLIEQADGQTVVRIEIPL